MVTSILVLTEKKLQAEYRIKQLKKLDDIPDEVWSVITGLEYDIESYDQAIELLARDLMI